MGFRCGIVGLPNVGKSTIFNALTATQVPAENYPFCTIDPNVGVVPVPDPRLDRIAAIVKPDKVVRTTIRFVDIAGLVKGASKGEGLGNQFLGHIREVDAIAHVVRCFEHDDVAHVTGRVDPVTDIEVVDTELALADLATVEKHLGKAEHAIRTGDKSAARQRDLLERIRAHLNQGRAVRLLGLGDEERETIRELFLLTIKPVMYIANVEESGVGSAPYVQQVQPLAAAEHAEVVPICADFEAEISQLDEADKAEFLAELGVEEPGLNRVIRAGYRLLGLQTFFTTTGGKQVQAWTVRAGATAPEAAGVVHTDFEKGFIRAEVVAYDDFIAAHGEHGAREAGKLRVEGRDYVVREGDLMTFRFNV